MLVIILNAPGIRQWLPCNASRYLISCLIVFAIVQASKIWVGQSMTSPTDQLNRLITRYWKRLGLSVTRALLSSSSLSKVTRVNLLRPFLNISSKYLGTWVHNRSPLRLEKELRIHQRRHVRPYFRTG